MFFFRPILITVLVWLVEFSIAQHINSSSGDNFAGWFTDQWQETGDDPVAVSVQGILPSWLKGELVRLSPSIVHTATRNFTNVLDGFGRITKYTIDGSAGKASFQSNILRTDLFNQSFNATKIPRHVTQQKTEPPWSLGGVNLTLMDNTDVMVENFHSDDDDLLVGTDFARMNVVQRTTLRTLGGIIYNDTSCKPCSQLFSLFSGSHAGRYLNTETGEVELVNWVGTKTVTGYTLTLFRMNSKFQRFEVGSANLPFTPYSIHSIVMAGNYAVLILGDVEMDFLSIPFNFCLSCSSSVHIKEKTGLILVFDVSDDSTSVPTMSVKMPAKDSFFVFHYINAYVDTTLHISSSSRHLVVDTCAYDSLAGVLGEYVLGDLSNLLNHKTRDQMPSNCNALRRVIIDLNAPVDHKGFANFDQAVSVSNFPIMDAMGNAYQIELASVSPLYYGKPACMVYAYTYHAHGSSRYEDMAVLKVDICKQNSSQASFVSMWAPDAVYMGEPLFVPDPASTAEDAGVIMVVTYNGTQRRTRLAVLDAQSMSPIAFIDAAFNTMFGFHGKWLNN
jgi:carotenoid cleavage dioxygenase-like enzyme